jgi:hypothetical protein
MCVERLRTLTLRLQDMQAARYSSSSSTNASPSSWARGVCALCLWLLIMDKASKGRQMQQQQQCSSSSTT